MGNTLERAKEFEYTNRACDVDLISKTVQNGERKHFFHIAPKYEAEYKKHFKFFKLTSDEREYESDSVNKADEMKLLLTGESENTEEKKERNLITKFAYLSSSDRSERSEDSSARDIKKFIENYGFFFDITESCEPSMDDIYSWSKRLNNFALLVSECERWKSFKESDFNIIFSCVMFFLTAGELCTKLGRKESRESYVFYFYDAMSLYVTGLPSIYDEQGKDYEDENEDEDIDLYETDVENDCDMNRIRKWADSNNGELEWSVLFDEEQIEKLRRKLIDNKEILENEEDFFVLLTEMGDSFIDKKISNGLYDTSKYIRCTNEVRKFIMNQYAHLRECPDIITRKAIDILFELKERKQNVEGYLACIIAPQLDIELDDEMIKEMIKEKEAVEKFMSDEMWKTNLETKLIELAELVINELINNQFKGTEHKCNYTSGGYEWGIDSLYTAMVFAICNLHKDWEYRKCKTCGSAFLIKRTTKNKVNCDICKK